jgi:hypothetical protein
MDEQESNLENLRQSIEDGERLAEKLKQMIAELDKSIKEVEDTLRKGFV